jgi:hypothetical protein
MDTQKTIEHHSIENLVNISAVKTLKPYDEMLTLVNVDQRQHNVESLYIGMQHTGVILFILPFD